jgi:hypothetical protein
MTPEEVEEAMERFLALLGREQEVKEELLALEMRGTRATPEELHRRLARHDNLIAEVGRLRREEMLPILERLTAFIASTRVNRVG